VTSGKKNFIDQKFIRFR